MELADISKFIVSMEMEKSSASSSRSSFWIASSASLSSREGSESMEEQSELESLVHVIPGSKSTDALKTQGRKPAANTRISMSTSLSNTNLARIQLLKGMSSKAITPSISTMSAPIHMSHLQATSRAASKVPSTLASDEADITTLTGTRKRVLEPIALPQNHARHSRNDLSPQQLAAKVSRILELGSRSPLSIEAGSARRVKTLAEMGGNTCTFSPTKKAVLQDDHENNLLSRSFSSENCFRTVQVSNANEWFSSKYSQHRSISPLEPIQEMDELGDEDCSDDDPLFE